MKRPFVVCVAPVKNESWILRRFVACAATWADQIIIADQQSDDDSLAIAQSFDRVRVIRNEAAVYDEASRQQLLLSAARETPFPRVIVALDADEMLSSNVLESEEWSLALASPPGTVLQFSKIDLYESPNCYFLNSAVDAGAWHALGYVDDGAEHVGQLIHSCRVPFRRGSPCYRFNDIVCLHYQFCAIERMASKHRWYRCFERIRYPRKRSASINRTYDWMDRMALKRRPSSPQWFALYEAQGIDMREVVQEPHFWWDWEVLRFFRQYGLDPFRRLDVWSIDWETLRRKGLEAGIAGIPTVPLDCSQRSLDRLFLWTLKRTGRMPGRHLLDLFLKLFA